MLRIVTSLVLLSAVRALLGPDSSLPRRARHSELAVVVDGSVPGQLPPTGFFDPLGLTRGIGDLQFKKYQEAELKHGRVAMLAAVGMLVAERFHPLWAGKVTGAAIYHFQVHIDEEA